MIVFNFFYYFFSSIPGFNNYVFIMKTRTVSIKNRVSGLAIPLAGPGLVPQEI